jgi:hypothetical protein
VAKPNEWRVSGSYFEACNCDAICPCRSVGGGSGGPSSYYVHVHAHGEASHPGDVRCGIPGFDHPGTELYGEAIESSDEHLRWEIRTPRRASFATEFDHASDT